MSYVTALKYTISSAPGGGMLYLGAEVTYSIDGKEVIEVHSSSKLRQKDVLDALNRGGYLYRGESAVGPLENSCPLFSTEQRPSEVDTINLDELAQTNQTKLINYANSLGKNYKFDETLIEKYRTQFLFIEEPANSEPTPTIDDTQQATAVDHLKGLAVASGESAGYNVDQLKNNEQQLQQAEPTQAPTQVAVQEPEQVQVQQPVEPVQQTEQVPTQQAPSISSDIHAVDSTAVRQPQAKSINFEDNWKQPQPIGEPEFFDVNPLTDDSFKFKMESNYPLPIILNTGQLEQFALRNKQRNPAKRNRQHALDHFGVQMITDGATYRQFLKDYIEGKIPVSDNRYWMNLNLFVHHSLLHVNFEDYFEDKLLKEYIELKVTQFRPEHFEKMREMIRLFPSPLISEKGMLYLEDLIELTAGNYYGLEMFALGLQYFLEDPIEGFNHSPKSTGIPVACQLKLPALTEANDVKTSDELVTILDKGYNPFANVGATLELIDEAEGVATIRVKKVKVSVRWEFDCEQKASVVLNSNGTWTFVTRKHDAESNRMVTDKSMSPGVYFQNKSMIDGFTNLGLPVNGLYDGLTEEEVIQLNKLNAKIDNMTTVEMNFTEFHGLERIAVGPSAIRRYVNGMSPSSTKEAPKDDDEVISTISSSGLGEVPLQDLVKTDYESLFVKMYRDIGSPHDIIKLMLMLKHGDVNTSNLTLPIVALANLNKSYKLKELLRVAMQNKLITAESAEAIIERATTSKEPINFNTPLTVDWSVDPTFLDDSVMEVAEDTFKRRLTNTGIGVAKVIGIATDEKGNDLGAIFEYSASKLKADEGEKIVSIETFVRLKLLALHGNITFLNGFVLNDGFIDFQGRTSTFERINLASVAHLQPLEMGNLFYEASYAKYSAEYLQPAFSQQSVELAKLGKELSIENFTFPQMTPFQMYFGIPYSEYLTMLNTSEWMLSIQYYNYLEGRPCLAKGEIEAYVKGTIESTAVVEVTQAKPTPTPTETPAPTEVQEQPVPTKITETPEQPVEQAEESKQTLYGVDEGIDFIHPTEDKPNATLALTVTKVIYPQLEGPVTNVNTSPVGVICEVRKDSSVSSTIKISLPTLYRVLMKPDVKVVNASVAPNAVIAENLKLGVLDNDYFGLRTLVTDERVDGIKHFDTTFTKNKEDARFEGKPFVIPPTPYNAGLMKYGDGTEQQQPMAQPQQPAPQQQVESAPQPHRQAAPSPQPALTEQQPQTTLDKYLEVGDSLRTQYDNIIGSFIPTLKYLYSYNGVLKTQGMENGKVITYTNNVDVLNKEKVRRQLGIIPYEGGGYLVKTVSGRVIVLDTEFNEV